MSFDDFLSGKPRTEPGYQDMLDDDAANLFADWREKNSDDQSDGPLAGWCGKMPGVCLRLALNLEYLWLATTTRQETFTVTVPAIEAATLMIDQYFKPMAARAYGDASLPQADRNAATLARPPKGAIRAMPLVKH
jgi:hypothetical protein